MIEKYPNIWKATYFSILFLIIFTPNNAITKLVSTLMEEVSLSTLGFIMLSINSLFQGFFSMLSTPLSYRYGHKVVVTVGALFLGCMTYVMIYPAWLKQISENERSGFANIYLIGTVCMLGYIIGGVGQAFLFVIQGEYLTLCATEKTKGFYIGYFWIFYNAS